MITLRFVPAPDQQYGKWGFIDIAVETFEDVMESLGTAWDKTTKTVEMDPEYSEMHIQVVFDNEGKEEVIEIGTYISDEDFELSLMIDAYESDISPDEPESIKYKQAGIAMNFEYEGEEALLPQEVLHEVL